MPPGNMPRIAGHFQNLGFGADILYSFVIIVVSLMIYFGTKELYELSGHKGIKYFRQSFLLFAIAYFFRFLIKLVMVYFNSSMIFDLSLRVLADLSVFVFIYASSMAILYLLLSVMYKRFDHGNKSLIFFHIIGIFISAVVVVTRDSLVVLGLHLVLFIFAAIFTAVAYFDSRKKKKTKKANMFYGLYVLLFAFFTISIVDLLVPNFFKTFQLIIYISSMTIFFMILYKVLKKSGSS